MEKISWIDRVGNEEVLQRVKQERNILHTANRRRAILIGQILLRNRLLKHVIAGKVEGRIEVTGRRGRRSRELIDGLKEKRGYCVLKDEALDRTLWITGLGRGRGTTRRQRAV